MAGRRILPRYLRIHLKPSVATKNGCLEQRSHQIYCAQVSDIYVFSLCFFMETLVLGFHNYYPKTDTHDPFSQRNNRKETLEISETAVLKALTWSRSRYPLEKKHLSTLAVTRVGLEDSAKKHLVEQLLFLYIFIVWKGSKIFRMFGLRQVILLNLRLRLDPKDKHFFDYIWYIYIYIHSTVYVLWHASAL